MPDLLEFKEDPEQSVVIDTDENIEDTLASGLDNMEHGHNDEVNEVHDHLPAGTSVLEPQHEPVVVTNPPTKPTRTRKPNVKYSANEYDLSLVRHRSRRQIRRAH